MCIVHTSVASKIQSIDNYPQKRKASGAWGYTTSAQLHRALVQIEKLLGRRHHALNPSPAFGGDVDGFGGVFCSVLDLK